MATQIKTSVSSFDGASSDPETPLFTQSPSEASSTLSTLTSVPSDIGSTPEGLISPPLDNPALIRTGSPIARRSQRSRKTSKRLVETETSSTCSSDGRAKRRKISASSKPATAKPSNKQRPTTRRRAANKSDFHMPKVLSQAASPSHEAMKALDTSQHRSVEAFSAWPESSVRDEPLTEQPIEVPRMPNIDSDIPEEQKLLQAFLSKVKQKDSQSHDGTGATSKYTSTSLSFQPDDGGIRLPEPDHLNFSPAPRHVRMQAASGTDNGSNNGSAAPSPGDRTGKPNGVRSTRGQGRNNRFRGRNGGNTGRDKDSPEPPEKVARNVDDQVMLKSIRQRQAELKRWFSLVGSQQAEALEILSSRDLSKIHKKPNTHTKAPEYDQVMQYLQKKEDAVRDMVEQEYQMREQLATRNLQIQREIIEDTFRRRVTEAKAEHVKGAQGDLMILLNAHKAQVDETRTDNNSDEATIFPLYHELPEPNARIRGYSSMRIDDEKPFKENVPSYDEQAQREVIDDDVIAPVMETAARQNAERAAEREKEARRKLDQLAAVSASELKQFAAVPAARPQPAQTNPQFNLSRLADCADLVSRREREQSRTTIPATPKESWGRSWADRVVTSHNSPPKTAPPPTSITEKIRSPKRPLPLGWGLHGLMWDTSGETPSESQGREASNKEPLKTVLPPISPAERAKKPKGSTQPENDTDWLTRMLWDKDYEYLDRSQKRAGSSKDSSKTVPSPIAIIEKARTSQPAAIQRAGRSWVEDLIAQYMNPDGTFKKRSPEERAQSPSRTKKSATTPSRALSKADGPQSQVSSSTSSTSLPNIAPAPSKMPPPPIASQGRQHHHHQMSQQAMPPPPSTLPGPPVFSRHSTLAPLVIPQTHQSPPTNKTPIQGSSIAPQIPPPPSLYQSRQSPVTGTYPSPTSGTRLAPSFRMLSQPPPPPSPHSAPFSAPPIRALSFGSSSPRGSISNEPPRPSNQPPPSPSSSASTLGASRPPPPPPPPSQSQPPRQPIQSRFALNNTVPPQAARPSNIGPGPASSTGPGNTPNFNPGDGRNPRRASGQITFTPTQTPSSERFTRMPGPAPQLPGRSVIRPAQLGGPSTVASSTNNGSGSGPPSATSTTSTSALSSTRPPARQSTSTGASLASLGLITERDRATGPGSGSRQVPGFLTGRSTSISSGSGMGSGTGTGTGTSGASGTGTTFVNTSAGTTGPSGGTSGSRSGGSLGDATESRAQTAAEIARANAASNAVQGAGPKGGRRVLLPKTGQGH